MIRRFTLLLFSLISIMGFGDTLEDGIALFNQGTSLYQNGEYSSAYEYLNRSIVIFEKEDTVVNEWLMNSYLWIGAAAYNLEKYNEAENYYLISLNLAKQIGSIQYQSTISGEFVFILGMGMHMMLKLQIITN